MTAELEVLKKDVGTWDAEVEVRFPGAPPQRSRGVSTTRLACDGKWLLTDFKNETSGFEGHGVYGWDASLGAYTGVWVDPMRGSLVVMNGSWDAATKTMTMRGTMKKPDGSAMAWRETTQTVDEHTQIFRSFVPGPNGEEIEVMTVTYRRRA